MKEIIPPNKTLTPEEYEQKLLQLEQKPTEDPLDGPAAIVKLYIPRFKIQLNNMSKKQIITLALDLSGSSYNYQEDINKIVPMSKDLGLSSLQRVIAGVVANPFDEIELKLNFEKEKKLFQLFDSLLTNKYFNCLIVGLGQAAEGKKRQELEDFILHSLDVNGTIFKKRSQVEKYAFFSANKLLCSKFLMLFVKINETREKEKENG